MDGLLVLLGLVLLAIPIAVLYLLVSHSGLKRRVTELERDIAALKADRRTQTDQASKPAADVDAIKPRVTSPRPAAPKTAAPKRATPARAQTAAVAAKLAEPGLPEQFFKWLVANWFYAVSALSLALAGLFLVQYGAENGYFPPTARVLAALAFGAALIGAGEVVRRRFGDGADTTTAYLPSVFSGAGLVSLFGGVTAARLLYGLIGVEVAFAGLALVGVVGIVLGWFNGPLLAAVGVIGAFVAPLLVGSDVPATPWLYLYFASVALVGLAIDTVRRWAWVSALSVGLAFGMGLLTYLGGAGSGMGTAFQLYALGLAVMALLIPARSVWPDHPRPTLSEAALAKGGVMPVFPTWLAAGSVLAACVVVTVLGLDRDSTFWMAVAGLGLLAAALAIWSVRGPALQDLAALPVVGTLVVVALEGLGNGRVARSFAAAYDQTSEADFPFAVTLLWLLGLALSALAAGRALRPGFGLAWAMGAALIAPVMAIALEMTWQPAGTIGAYAWALHAIIMAGVMVGFAARFAQADGAARLRVSVFVLSALASISFALVLILSSAALTVALAVTVVAAASLDRRFGLPLMQVFISVGVVAVGARLIADPGLGWALEAAQLWEVVLAYGGALAAFCIALVLLRGLVRSTAQVMLDTAAWSTGGVLVSVLLYRMLEALTAGHSSNLHWSMGLYATIWLVLSVTQLIRLERLGGRLALVRGLLAALFGLTGVGALALGLTVFNPVLSDWGGRVAGPAVLNTLIVAYLLPALILVAGAVRIKIPALRLALAGAGGALAVFWGFVALRHLWQGAETLELRYGFLQAELWSYTLALLLAGAGVFYQSLARNAVILRRAGLMIIGAAVAKVFLIDISGLDGLTRVLSLVVLGLSLAGLAWLNRWAQTRTSDK